MADADDLPGDPADAPPAPTAHPSRVASGVLGLLFGGLAVACLLLGFCTWGVTWYGVGPFGCLGVAFSLVAPGRARVAGLVVGLLTAALGIAFLVAMN